MSGAHIPQDIDERARLMRLSFLRMLSIRVRRAGTPFLVAHNQKRGTGNPVPGASDEKGGGLPIRQTSDPPESTITPERREL